MQKIKKAALFTDIHWGRMGNSELHNKDCLRFIEWFCTEVKSQPDIDCVIFMGDWHEHRSAINGMTLKYSYDGISLLNTLNIPIYFIIGNHDLYNRNNRDIYTTNPFEHLKNVILINKPTIVETVDGKAAITPYLFPQEYVELQQMKVDYIFGHLEFKGFIVTGEYKTLDHGPSHTDFKKFKKIFTGHFHRRQIKDNIVYIGNTFPADFGDANDFERGMATYDFSNQELKFTDWKNAPTYIKCNLSDIIENPKAILKKDARVKCIVDIDITLQEGSKLKESLIKKFELRELNLEEQYTFDEIQGDNEFDLSSMDLESTPNIIKEMLRQMKSDKIDNTKLIRIFEEL
jgi:DNA repair exonuclease SbcCD nuclease subunit